MIDNSDSQQTASADGLPLAGGRPSAEVRGEAQASSGSIKPVMRRRRRKLWPLIVGCAFLTLGVIVASGIGSNGSEEAKSGELTVEGKPAPAGVGDDAERFGDRIVALVSNVKIESAEHPIDPLLELADEGFIRIDETIRDYTATLVSQVRIDGTLQAEQRIQCKIRHARESETVNTPLSIYMKMETPAKLKGQEVIWVDGENDGCLVAHTTGIFNVKRFVLDPQGAVAMNGTRYPIYDVGFKNLIKKMKEFGLSDRDYDECEVTVTRDIPIDNRPCTMIEVVHPVKRDHFSHHISKIYLDQTSDVLVGYEGFLWPDKPGGKPPLFERYFYLDLQINVGLTDEDFSADNKEYNFPGW